MINVEICHMYRGHTLHLAIFLKFIQDIHDKILKKRKMKGSITMDYWKILNQMLNMYILRTTKCIQKKLKR